MDTSGGGVGGDGDGGGDRRYSMCIFFFFWSPLGCIVEAVGQVGSNLLLTYLGSKSTLSMWSGLTWDER